MQKENLFFCRGRVFFNKGRLFLNKRRLFSNKGALLRNKGWFSQIHLEFYSLICIFAGKRVNDNGTRES